MEVKMKKLLQILWIRPSRKILAIDDDEDLWLHLDGAEFMVFPYITPLNRPLEYTPNHLVKSRVTGQTGSGLL